MQYRLAHLFGVTLVVAVGSMIVATENSHDAAIMLFTGALLGIVVGLACGRLVESSSDALHFDLLMLLVYLSINGISWSLLKLAMWGVTENTLDLAFPPALYAMEDIYEHFGFRIVAVLLAAGCCWAAMRRNSRLLNLLGAATVGFWFIVFAIGFVSVGIILFQDMGVP